MLEASLKTIDEHLQYYECGDFPFNFAFVSLTESSTADNVRQIIEIWVDYLPADKTANWLVSL